MLKIIKKRVALILAVSLIISSFQISVKAATSDVIDYGYDKHLVNIQIKDETGASYLGTEYEVYDSNNNKLLSVTNSNNPCIFSSDLKAVTDLSKGMYPTNFESLLGKKIQGIHYIGATTTTSSGTSNYTLCYGQSPAKELKNVDLSLQYGLEYTLKINYYEYMPTAITLQENTVAVLNNSPNSYQAYVRLNNDEKIYPEYDGTNTPSYYEYEPGNYKLYTGVQNGGGAVGPPKVVVSDEKKEYFKVKIHLATVFPDYFTDEGLMKIKDSYKRR